MKKDFYEDRIKFSISKESADKLFKVMDINSVIFKDNTFGNFVLALTLDDAKGLRDFLNGIDFEEYERKLNGIQRC